MNADVAPGCSAAVEAGRIHGIVGAAPVVIQETNNTVVWLRPHPVIAKVATRADSAERLVREHEVAGAAHRLGAPVAEPWPGAGPHRDAPTGFTVTLWRRLEHDRAAPVAAATIGSSLRLLHEALAATTTELPDFRVALARTRTVLSDDDAMAALSDGDLAFLRRALDDLLPGIEGRAFAEQVLHGEPHGGNRLVTASGIRWIDLEDVCRGPVEWDLAFLPKAARDVFTGVDDELLGLLCALNSARVATWCWTGSSARFPEMRRHGEEHLVRLQQMWPGPA